MDIVRSGLEGEERCKLAERRLVLMNEDENEVGVWIKNRASGAQSETSLPHLQNLKPRDIFIYFAAPHVRLLLISVSTTNTYTCLHPSIHLFRPDILSCRDEEQIYEFINLHAKT
jgi:hypothetical protein